MRPIDADALYEKRWDVPFETKGAHFVQVVDAEDILAAPSVDPEDFRPKGKWNRRRTPDAFWTCSACRKDTWFASHYAYCPKCGAKMEVEVDENV